MSILIEPYDSRWPARFEAEARRLRAGLGDLADRIEHVGSTAVPGLAAKPVIDIQVSLPDLSREDECRARLAELGYTFTRIPLPYHHRPACWPHTHHVHLRASGSYDELRVLRFRDWLRTHPEDRAAYEALKRALAEGADPSTAAGRARYSDAKTAFVRRIEARAHGALPGACAGGASEPRRG